MAIQYKVVRVATPQNLHCDAEEVLEETTFNTREEALVEVAKDNHNAISSVRSGTLTAIPYYAQIHEVYVDDRTPEEILHELKRELEWLQHDDGVNWVVHDRRADIRDLADDLENKLKENNDE